MIIGLAKPVSTLTTPACSSQKSSLARDDQINLMQIKPRDRLDQHLPFLIRT
jgi:hypothetical protein